MSASAWREGWGRRIKIPISPTTAGRQTDYQMTIALIKGSGTSSAGIIYLQDGAHNWPYDITFTRADGTTELSFRRVESDDTDGTWVVTVDEIDATEDTDIWLYWRNADAEDGSNAENSYAFFDGAETNDFANWDYVGANWSIVSSPVVDEEYAFSAPGGAYGYQLEQYECKFDGGSSRIRLWVRSTETNGYFYFLSLYSYAAPSVAEMHAYAGNLYIGTRVDGSELVCAFSANIWHLAEIIIDFENANAIFYFDNVYLGTKSIAGYTTWKDVRLVVFAPSLQSNVGYIDNISICKYIYPEPVWATPGTMEYAPPSAYQSRNRLEDGLYAVIRGVDSTLLPEQIVRSYAYNDYDMDFLPIMQWPVTGNYSFGGVTMQDDRKLGVLAHYSDITSSHYVISWRDLSDKNIVDVTVSAFISGRGRTVFRHTKTGTAYYGTITTRGHVASWVDTVYTTDPATSLPWDGAVFRYGDFRGTDDLVRVGVDLRAPRNYIDPAYPYTPNTEETPSDEFPGDDRLYELGSLCYCTKIAIRYYDDDPNDIQTYTLYPSTSAPMEGTGNPCAYFGNHMGNGIISAHDSWYCLLEDVYAYRPDAFFFEFEFPTAIRNLVGSYGSETVRIRAQWSAGGLSPPDCSCVPYLQLGGIKYYGAEQTSEFASWTYFDWATNPATSAAWAGGDIAEGDGYGLEFRPGSSSRVIAFWCRLDGQLWASGVQKQAASGASGRYTVYEPISCSYRCWTNVLSLTTPHQLRGAPGQLSGDMRRYFPYFGNKDEMLSKSYTTDLSEIPPSFSQITGFTVYSEVYAWSDNYEDADNHWNIFIEIGGVRYYSDDYTMAGNPNLLVKKGYSWDINPATEAAWTYDEFQGVRYGVEVSRDSKYTVTMFRPYALYADTKFNPIVGPLQPEYKALPVLGHTTTLKKNSNTPKFNADELSFVLPVGYYLPERSEIVLSRDGAQVFHGFIWQADQRPNKETQILAKSQSHALACRYIPNFFYHARNSRFASVYSLADLFSDDVPVGPNESYWMVYASHDGVYNWYHYLYDQYGNLGEVWLWQDGDTPEPVSWICYSLGSTHSNLGIFFILNSMIPYGATGETEYYRHWQGPAFNRAKFLFSHNPSVIPLRENIELTWDTSIISKGMPGYVYPLGVVEDTLPTNEPDHVGAVRRFRIGDSEDLDQDEYVYSGDDLKVGHYPGAYTVLLDHALDTFLRPGAFELDDKYLAMPYLFNGSYANAFSDFFFRLGQEVWFRNDADGYVYMDSASELGRATALRFMDGKNATVTKSIRDPSPACVLGNEFQPRISTDWMPARTWLTKIEYTQRTGVDLQEWVDLKRDEDKSTWTVKIPDKLWHIMPGDHIIAQARGQGLEDVRVRKAVITNAGTTLTCGKRLYDLSEEWGQWRSVKGSTDADTDMPIQAQEIDFGNCDDSQTFNVLAEEYETGSWKCKLSVSWDLDVDEGYTADLASAPLGMFLVVQVNSKVVPPGRIQARGNSGSTEIDITEFCTCSTSTDEENTVAIKLWRGVTATNWRHTISGSITQYRRLEAVDNA